MFDHYYCIIQLLHKKIWRNCPDFAKIQEPEMARKMTLANYVLKMRLTGQTSTSSWRHNIKLNQMHVTQ